VPGGPFGRLLRRICRFVAEAMATLLGLARLIHDAGDFGLADVA
jgi:hypothetical protein